MLCKQDDCHGYSIVKSRKTFRYLELNITSTRVAYESGVSKQLTSMPFIDSIILHREHKQRHWKFPEE